MVAPFLHAPSPTRRDFKFSGNKLTSTKHVEPGVPDGTLTVPTTIERVVFLGLPAAKKGYKAVISDGVSGAKHTVALEAGPLSMAAAPDSTQALVLRKPDLPVSHDWTVEIVQV